MSALKLDNDILQTDEIFPDITLVIAKTTKMTISVVNTAVDMSSQTPTAATRKMNFSTEKEKTDKTNTRRKKVRLSTRSPRKTKQVSENN